MEELYCSASVTVAGDFVDTERHIAEVAERLDENHVVCLLRFEDNASWQVADYRRALHVENVAGLCEMSNSARWNFVARHRDQIDLRSLVPRDNLQSSHATVARAALCSNWLEADEWVRETTIFILDLIDQHFGLQQATIDAMRRAIARYQESYVS